MNPNHLQALLIDQHLGELPPEVSDLLDAYLERCPEAVAEAGQVRDVLGVTREAVTRHPEIVPASELTTTLPTELPRIGLRPVTKPALRLAAMIALSGTLIAGSYFAGWSRSEASRLSAPPTVAAEATPEAEASPWARYRVDADGRLAVVVARTSNESQPKTRSLP